MLKVTLIPAKGPKEKPRAAIELTGDSAAMLKELVGRTAAPGAQARVLADLFDAVGTADALLNPAPPPPLPPPG